MCSVLDVVLCALFGLSRFYKMAPSPQEQAPMDTEVSSINNPNRVVISGMSGLYPDCNHVLDLADILYNKKNPVSAENSRWKYNHPEVAQHTGKIPKLDLFDAQFFKVHYKLCKSMDAMARKILEQAFQAIYDAGVSPEHLSGRKIGVYIGTCFSETEKACFYVASSRTGFGIAGCSKTMFANRISYWLNAKGPSLSIDEACCSSIAAVEQAYLAISRGECEAAIVGGANLCLHPQSSIHYGRIMKVCMDGKTKSFDQNADGCAKSEAINILFLQKAKDALRIYADILYVKSEFTEVQKDEAGGPRFGFYRQPSKVVNFLNNFYKEAGIPPQAVEYVEAFGSAVLEADKSELEALGEVFCRDRTDPLLVGSIMSNIGYAEAAAGICGINKVLLGYQKGELAGNLHCTKPIDDVKALQEGKMKILTDHTKFNRTYAAVNGMSVTGVNAHVLLHGYNKPKDLNRYKSSIPQLVTISGRQESSVRRILTELNTHPLDPEQLELLRNIHKSRISGHMGRGFTILDTGADGKTFCIRDKADYFDDAKRPLWFVYSGMGSQWAGMGAQLMRIPLFAAAIEKCRRVLEPKGVDIVHIITSPDKTIFDNILHSFVGIAAVQIGLTDILKALGIVPDKIIGHSVGELGCAYADGCFTAEEMILSAYSRGLVSVQTPFIKGSMAAVGIGYQEVINLCPPEIEVACHNGPDSCTISGPADVMKKFVTELTVKDIFAKEVPCSNIAYHSRYIAEAGPGLLKYLREVIKDPKPRSDRWVSTSVPRERWSEHVAKYSSADYHTNNLLNPVLFEETSVLIPANAVCVEIAPHGLLQAILKRSLPGTCQHIPLTRRGHPDNVLMVLEGIGKLYLEGFNPNVKALYPKVELPVSTGTPMLSHLVEWAHNEPWNLALYMSARRKTAAACKYVISLFDDEYKYLQGHIVRGKNMYPFAASLMNAWNTLSMSVGAGRLGAGADGGVTFRNLRLHAAPTLHENDALSLKVQLHRGTGNFEILDEHSNVATGFISLEVDALKPEFSKEFSSNEKMTLNSEDVYRILNERDYAYKGSFRPIISSNASFTEAEIAWEDNWVTFLEGILQLFALREMHDGVSRPFIIRRLTIDLKEHALRVREVGGRMVATAQVFEEHGFTRCGGVVIENVKLKNLPPLVEETVSLQTLKFFPRFQAEDIDIPTALQVHLQILSENISKDVINVVGIPTLGCDDTVFNRIVSIVNDVPGITVNYEQLKKEKILDERDHFLTEVDLVVVQNLSIDENLCQTLYRVLQRDTFVLNLEQKEIDFNRPRPSGLYRVVASYNAGNSKIELTKWRPTVPNAATTAVSVRDPADIELLKNTRNDIPNRQKLIIFATYPVPPGLKELVRKWRGEAEKNQIYVFMVNENDAENLFDKLPELDLAFNTLSQGIWGGMYYVPCSSQPQAGTLVCLQSKGVNDLQSIHWAQVASPKTDGLMVQVHFAGLNDTDAKRAAGVYPFPPNSELGDTYYGMDYSGVTDKGVRVMGVVAGGAARSRVAAGRLTWPLPAHWSLQDAATVPLPYAHAAYCLGVKMRMWRGMRLLIHGGAGALGQAAISIALAHDCEVFTTVSDVRKKRFLTKLFPELKEDHIGNSRDHTFGDMVLSLTKGKGVDVIISNTKGDLKNISMSCCGNSGIMFDTVQLQSQEEYEFGMHYLTLERNYVNVDFSSILLQDNLEDLLIIQKLVADGISRGYVRPLSRVVFPAAAAGRALALLQGSRHRGRVLLDLTAHTDHLPRLVCSPSTSYALVIDDESFGLQVAERLITRGAMKLLIHVQKTSNFMEYKIRSWQKLGVEVQIMSLNLIDANNAVSFVRTAQKQAPLEGLYVVCNNHDDVTDRKFVIMLTNLDAAARKLCPDIKNFVVVSEESDIGAQVCLQRIAANLPATALQLPKLKQVQDSPPCGRQVSWRGGVECVERAVSAAPAVLRGRGAARPRTLLQQLADRAEITIPSDAKEWLTLQDLGVEASKVAGIAAFLRDVHNVAISEGDIPSLTIAKIKEIHLSVYGSTLAEVRGLGTFFGYVDPDEMLATTEMVFLPTLVNSATMRDDEFDVSQTYLSVVPGLEGHYKRFESISARLQLPALVLQPGLDRATDDHIKRAHAYAQILLKKTELKNNFYLLGYESGVIVALEMAAILEEHGLFGTVFCIGVTPEELKTIVLEEIGDFDETNLRERVMRHMFTLMGGQNTAELEQALSKTSSWEERLDTCVRTLLGHVAHSIQYTKSQIEAAVTSIQQMVNFQSKPKKLKSKIIFLRAKGAKSKDLQAFSEQPVTVYDLDLPLAHCARDMRCSAIINNHLDEKSVELFKNKNLCETYLLNADVFMSTSGE